MRRTILLLAGAALLLVSVDAGAEGIRPSSDTASPSKQHERTITAELSMGYGWTKGMLLVAGRLDAGRAACERRQELVFQRLWPSGWRKTGVPKPTDRKGKFSGVAAIKGKHPNGSKWRVVAPESTLADGDVCLRAVSPVMVHQRDRS